MTRPESLFEAASYDLNKFRERRMADRRFMARDTPDRRKSSPAVDTDQQYGEENSVGKNGNDNPAQEGNRS